MKKLKNLILVALVFFVSLGFTACKNDNSGNGGNQNQQKQSYTITYQDTKGLTNENPTTYTEDTETIILKDLENTDDYEFLGWYNGEAKVTKITKGSKGNLTLTAKWNKKLLIIYENSVVGVTSAGKVATKIEIPNGVTSILDNAFSYCTVLSEVIIPNSVISIEYRAFYRCGSLTSITIPDSVTSIGDDTFEDCSNLTSITIGNNVTSIGRSAFMGCSSLKYNTYDNAKYLGNNENPYLVLIKAINKDITTFKISSNTKVIYSFAFSDCRSLTSVTIGNSVTSIGADAFSECSSLTSITIPDSVTSIEDYAFSYCRGLTSVTIGNSVTSIGYQAFQNCSSLTSITIGNSVTSIGGSAFSGCSSLKYNTYDNAKYLGNNENPYLVLVEAINTNITTCTINSNTKVIHSSAFCNCISLTSITIPNSVTSIGNDAFLLCRNLTSIYYTGTIENWCNITFSDNDSNPMYYASQFYIKNSNGEYEELTEIEIPSSITKINSHAFCGFNNVTKVTIPNSVTSIGDSAFYNCSSLTSVTIPNSVTRIGEYAFSGCSSLTSVTFEDTNGWMVANDWNEIHSLSSEELSNVSIAAKYLTSVYCDFYWKKV